MSVVSVSETGEQYLKGVCRLQEAATVNFSAGYDTSWIGEGITFGIDSRMYKCCYDVFVYQGVGFTDSLARHYII